MKALSRSKQYLIFSTFFWLIVLQGALAYFSLGTSGLWCNESAPWPLATMPILGTSIVTFGVTLFLLFYASRYFQGHEAKSFGEFLEIAAWALILGTGISHSVERLASGCVLDYWHMSPFPFWFNLGDTSLFFSGMILAFRLLRWGQKK